MKINNDKLKKSNDKLEENFIYFNSKNHPRGTLMLEQLINSGIVPTLVIEEYSQYSVKSYFDQKNILKEHIAEYTNLNGEKICEDNQIPYFIVKNLNNKKTLELVFDNRCNLGVLGDTRIIHSGLINSFNAIINVHPGFLPYVRGNNPYIWAIIHNLPQGVTAHFVDDGVDTGPIIHRTKLKNWSGLEFKTLVHKINILCSELLVESINMYIDNKINLTLQKDIQLTFKEASNDIRHCAEKILQISTGEK